MAERNAGRLGEKGYTMAREYFAAYHSYLESIEELDDAERGRLFTACLRYSRTGEEQKLNGNARFVWPAMRAQIDRDKKSYDARCEANRRNVRKRYTKDDDRIRSHTKSTKEKEKEKEKTKAKENAKEKEKENALSFPDGKEREGAKAPCADRPRRSLKPTLGEITDYCTENGYTIDAQRFCDFYESKGWCVGSSPMKDWRAAVRNWVRKDAEKAKERANATGVGAFARARRNDGRAPIEQHAFTDERLDRLLVDLDAALPDEPG